MNNYYDITNEICSKVKAQSKLINGYSSPSNNINTRMSAIHNPKNLDSVRGEKQKYRDNRIDLIKCFAILLVVYGHTYPSCRKFIYLFHVPIFLMASGYCYNSVPRNLREWANYFWKKVRGLYIPYVLCNVLFLLLTNVFIALNIYTDNPSFLTYTEGWIISQSVIHKITLYDALKGVCRILMFQGTTQLGTATWFLSALFYVLIFHSFLEMLIWKCGIKRNIVLAFIFMMMLGVASLINYTSPNLLGEIKRFPCTYVAFLIGMILKRLWAKWLYSGYMGFTAFLILIIMSTFQNVEISAAKIGNPILFIIGCFSGWILLMTCADLVNKWNANMLIDIGQRTMPILCLHVISFKLISLLYVIVNSKPSYLIASWHIILTVSEWWKIIYTFIGVIAPMFAFKLYLRFKNRCLYRQ